MLLLAEIADKMPSLAGTTVVACVIGLISLGFGLVRRWLVLLAAPVIVFYDWALWSELHEPGFGQLIIDEFGWGWIIGQLVGWNVPYSVSIAIALLGDRSPSAARSGAIADRFPPVRL
ncbi:MAG: hypothetical protein JNG88_08865 [Phycisphaerales bacterium]|nr:hypothetical protein [Phycisphaerales bacterium]